MIFKKCNHEFKQITKEVFTLVNLENKTEEKFTMITSQCKNCNKVIIHDEQINIYDYYMEV